MTLLGRITCRLLGLGAFWGVACVCAAGPLLVVTKGRSAQNVSTGSFLHGVNLETGGIGAGLLISDQNWNSILSFDRNRHRIASVGLMRSGAWASGVEVGEPYPLVVELDTQDVRMPIYSPQEEVVAHFWGYDPASVTDLLCTVYRGENSGRLTYRVGDKTVSITLSGIPVMAMPTPDGSSAVIVLREADSDDYSIQVCELGGRRRIGKAIELSGLQQRYGVEAQEMLISPNNQYLYIAFSGYGTVTGGGNRSSWIQGIDLESSTRLGEALPVEGMLYASGGSMESGTDDSCWVVSHTSGQAHGFATHIDVSEGTLKVLAALTFSGVDSQIRVAVSPDNTNTALGIGNEVVLYDEKDRPYRTLAMDESVGALFWSRDGLVVGQENRVVRVNQDNGNLMESAALDTGIVAWIGPHPVRSALIDSNPGMKSPRWIRSMVFHEDQIGIERFAVASPGLETTGIAKNESQIPAWLMLNPSDTEHVGDTLSIDPAKYSRTPTSSRIMLVPMKISTRKGNNDYETLFKVRVDAADASRSTILWVRNPADHPKSILSHKPANPFAHLVRLLESYPFAFEHSEIAQPGNLSIHEFTVVVLTSASAEYGIFTRQVLLDYLASGGTILYLASASSNVIGETTGRWLEALGIQLDSRPLANNGYESISDEDVMRHWENVALIGGTGFQVSDRNSILAGDDADAHRAVAVTRTYGLGRLIAIASSAPFENKALNGPRGLRLAQGFFRRLTNVASDRADTDGDGIPDRIEDRNGNGRHDGGETHFADPDTDGDGIFDGIEDRNQNGFVDDIETSPLLADTDGDGILDAADRHPLPPSGAPYLSSVTPDSMPAEGSGTVLIQGRNFTMSSEIWIGGHRSPKVILLSRNELKAVVPPRIEGGSERIDVEIRDSDFDISSTLENGFRYDERSSVGLVLRAVQQVRIQYGMYQLRVVASLDQTPIRVNRASVVVEALPHEAVEYLGVTAGKAISNDRQRMQVTVLGQGRLRVTLSDPNSFIPGLPLFEIQCRLNMLKKPAPGFTFRVVEKELRTPYDGTVGSQERSELVYSFKGSVQIPWSEG